MQTDALQLAKQTRKLSQPERLTWGVVEFQVTDLNRTVTFWTKALGLRLRDRSENRAALGTQTQTLFVFHAGASAPVSAGHLGLYHVAIGVPSQAEFSRVLARLISLRVPISPVDHLMSKAIYLHDPDGLEIEIAFETPERFGSFGDMSKGLILYDANGQSHSGRAQLDAEAELLYAQDADIDAHLSEGTRTAHLHFKVGQLESAAQWFEGIGFARNLMLPIFGFADMGAGASYTHRLAMNIWAGPNLNPAPADMARLTHYTLYAEDPVVLESAQVLQATELGLKGQDPTGTDMSLVPAF